MPSMETSYTVVMIRDGLPVYAVEISTDTNMVYADQISNIADVFWK
jgi:hypothetical protein